MRRRASPDGSDFHCCRSGLVVHDAFFRFVIDMGGPGPDLILPPDYNGDLNPLGINCLRTFPLYGTVSWGARTMDGADAMASEWKYIPVRRMAL